MKYKINKKILLESSIFEPRSLSDDGLVARAMKNKNKYEINSDNSILNKNKPSYFDVSHNKQNNTNEHSQNNVHSNDVLSAAPKYGGMMNITDVNTISNIKKDEIMYAKPDPFKAPNINKHELDQHVDNSIGH